MKPAPTPKAVLSGIVKQRSMLWRTGRSQRIDNAMRTTVAMAEDMLRRMPSDAAVAEWMRQRKEAIMELLPSTDKNRRQYIAEL
jgi:hypothetical protein